ncbi:MAG: ArnT family glycosyltransferase [Candidatus Scalindua sp.]
MTHIYDFILVLGLFIAASGCGLWLLGLLRLSVAGRLQHVFFASGLGLGLVGYVTFVLGLTALLRQSVIACTYVLLLLLGIWGWRRFLLLRQLHWVEVWVRIRSLSWPEKILLGFLGFIAGINLLAALAPVIGVDELIYRLAAADLYLRHERIFYIPSIWLHQQPQQIQMIQLWGMSLGSDSTAQVIQWAMGVMLLLVLIDFGRREMPLFWALLGGAILYSYSDVIILSGRASPDLANALFMVLSLLAWVNWLKAGGWRWLVLAGLFAGLFAAGARLPGAYGAIALAVLVFIYGWRRFHWRPQSALALGLLVGSIAFLVVLPWYMKTYFQTGSPFWPFLFNIFGACDWTPEAFEYAIVLRTKEVGLGVGKWLSLERVLFAPWHLSITPERFNSGVMGPLVLAVLPMALLVRLPARLRYILAACGILACFWYISFVRLRTFIPGVSFLSIIAVYILWRLCQSVLLPYWTRVIVFCFIALWLLVGLCTTVRFHLRAALVTMGTEDESKYLSQRLAEEDMKFYWYDDYQVLNRILPESSRLLIYDSRGYHLKFDYDVYAHIARREAKPERLHDPDYVAEKVSELGSDYVVLWPEPKYATAYEPSNWLEDSLYKLCRSRWPIIYESKTMIVYQVKSISERLVP